MRDPASTPRTRAPPCAPPEIIAAVNAYAHKLAHHWAALGRAANQASDLSHDFKVQGRTFHVWHRYEDGKQWLHPGDVAVIWVNPYPARALQQTGGYPGDYGLKAVLVSFSSDGAGEVYAVNDGPGGTVAQRTAHHILVDQVALSRLDASRAAQVAQQHSVAGPWELTDWCANRPAKALQFQHALRDALAACIET